MAGQATLFDFVTIVPANEPVSVAQTKQAVSAVEISSPRKAVRQKQSPLEKFIKEFDGIIIDDSSNEASVNAKKSESFIKFCRALKSALNKEAKQKGFSAVSLYPGHYDLYGFFKYGEKFVYYSFNVQRYGCPTTFDRTDALGGFLYRTASSEKDFKGGNNHFCRLSELVDNALLLVTR
jgi:hypothetical protein